MATTKKTREITEAAMFAALARAGETPPSSGQLKRWRRAGLLPRPRVEHRAGVKGSRSWYPVWASEQLLVVVRLHQATHRLGELCTALWWEGHWVDPPALRRALLAPLDRFSAAASKARGGEEDPYEAADRILRTMPDDGKPSTMVTMMRSRLNGPADFLDLMWTFLVVGLGGQAPWEQEDCSRPDPAPGALQLLVSATGIDRAMRDMPAGRAPWLPEDFDPRGFIAELRDVGGFAIEDLAAPIREASDEQLEQARCDALLFSKPLAMIGSVLQDMLGTDVVGLGSLSAIAPTNSFDRAGLVRTMLIMRQLAGDGVFTAVAELVEDVHERFAAIAELRAALPQHESLLRADYAERLDALQPEEADAVRHDVARYLRARPSLAAALGAGEQSANAV
jgi:hypothetical protein